MRARRGLELARGTLAPLGLVLLAFAARALPWRSVLEAERAQMLEPDAYYHLRRIVFALCNPPQLLGFDPFLNFPAGARAIWPPLFDAAIARALLLFAPPGGFTPAHAPAVERLLVWVPPALGTLGVLALYGLMRRHFGSRAAFGAGVLACLLPGSVWYARIGVLDHHVAVALVSTLLLAAGMELLRAFRTGRSAVPAAACVAALQATMLLLWPGGLLHVCLVEAGIAIFWLTRERARDAAACAGVFGAAQAASLAAMLLFGGSAEREAGSLAPTLLSWFQPLFFAAGALLGVGCALGFRLPASSSRAARGGLTLGLGVALAALGWWLFPDLARGLLDAWSWLGRGERFQGSVLESRPILLPDGAFDTRLADLQLSRFFLLLPVALAALALRELRAARRGAGRPELLLLVGFSAGLALATLLQARFFDAFSLPYAGCFALSVGLVFERAAGAAASRIRRGVVAGGLAVVLALLLSPIADAYRLDVANQLGFVRGRLHELVLSPEDRYWRALDETARWIAAHTPSPGDPYDPRARPGFGVLGHWQYGHVLQYVAERPAVVGNFGDDVGAENYALSFEYFRSPEARAVEILDALRARYVVIRPIDALTGPPDSVSRSFAEPDGGDTAHHRLVYERRVLQAVDEKPRSHFRVFERVAGADVGGGAAAGARVEARLPWWSPTGRSGEFHRSAVADAAGRYRLRLPYSTQGAPPGIRVADAWQIGVAGGDAHALVIPERAVLGGEAVAGPDLR